MAGDLAAKVLAAIKETEQAAREAQSGPWYIGNTIDPTKLCKVHTFPGVRGVAACSWLDAAHIVRHNPENVLRGCEADREMLKRQFGYAALIDGEWGCGHDAKEIEAGDCENHNPMTGYDLPILCTLAKRYNIEVEGNNNDQN
jgi:hypothetical protein